MKVSCISIILLKKSYFPCFPTGYLMDPSGGNLVTLSQEFSKWLAA
jgi:hypothetical protein